MDLDQQITKYRALDAWFKTPQGARVAHAFSDEIMKFRDQLRGDCLLQIGLCGENTWLGGLRFRQKWLVSPYRGKKSTLLSSLHFLPFETSSIDCVVAPLILEAFPHHRCPLDEIDRVVKSMGYVIFFGVNPWSLWGASVGFGKHTCFGNSHGTLTTSLTLKRDMMDRGYQQCILSSFYYIPPVQHRKLIQSLEFLNVMGKMLWPWPPGFYCLVFQKNLSCPSAWLQDLAKEPFLLRRPLQASHRTIHEIDLNK